jgi:hypothetical protein
MAKLVLSGEAFSIPVKALVSNCALFTRDPTILG